MYEYDDFMASVGTVADLGSGSALLDLKWWTTRTTRDELQLPLNIKGNAFDLIVPSKQVDNVTFSKTDIQTLGKVKRKFDVLWCHDVFQYLENPYQALRNWYNIANENAMLVLIFPQTVNMDYRQQAFNLLPGHLYHYTITSLIYMLAVSGWDCKEGFFKKSPNDQWLHAIVYKSEIEPMVPGANWYEILEKGLLPESADKSILNYGYIKQSDLVLPWLDKSNHWWAQQ